MPLINPNSLDNKGSWRILKDFYCSVTMLRKLGISYIEKCDIKYVIKYNVTRCIIGSIKKDV